jgi:hypothetical protein
MTTQPDDGRRTARWLGYLGLIPFVAGAALALAGDPPVRDLAVRAVVAYGAVIASFVGAVHWGLALSAGKERASTLYLVSVLPSLAGWLALLLAPRTGLLLLIAVFVLVWAYERATLWPSLFPDWFPALRTRLTAIAVATLAIVAVTTPRFG